MRGLYYRHRRGQLLTHALIVPFASRTIKGEDVSEEFFDFVSTHQGHQQLLGQSGRQRRLSRPGIPVTNPRTPNSDMTHTERSAR